MPHILTDMDLSIVVDDAEDQDKGKAPTIQCTPPNPNQTRAELCNLGPHASLSTDRVSLPQWTLLPLLFLGGKTFFLQNQSL